MGGSDRKRIGRILGGAIVLGALLTGLVVLHQTSIHPRTDDAEVFANFIGIAPEVSGRIIRIDVQDNQLVQKGELLFEIDPLPYQYALEKAKSQQAALEGQIKDLEREVSSENSAILSARAKRSGECSARWNWSLRPPRPCSSSGKPERGRTSLPAPCTTEAGGGSVRS
jgi:multidrug efflux system membrane fusion protein